MGTGEGRRRMGMPPRRAAPGAGSPPLGSSRPAATRCWLPGGATAQRRAQVQSTAQGHGAPGQQRPVQSPRLPRGRAASLQLHLQHYQKSSHGADKPPPAPARLSLRGS